MKNIKFNLIVLISLIILLTITISINIVVDPFSVFDRPQFYGFNKVKPELKRQERLTKVFYLILNKKKFDTIILGSSRVDYGFDSEYYFKKTGLNSYNSGIKATGVGDGLEIVKKLIHKNSNLKQVLIGVDFFAFKKPPEYLINLKDQMISTKLNDFASILLSLDAVECSINTILYNLKTPNINIYDKNGLKIMKNDHNAYNEALYEVGAYMNDELFYKNYVPDSKGFNDLKELKSICHKNNIELIVFVNPINVAQLQAIKTSNNWQNYKNWKKNLSYITPYYDFSGFNSVTTEPLNKNMKYYIDSNHYLKNTSHLMIDAIINPQKRIFHKDFGIYINSANVEQSNAKLDKDYNEWSKKNQILVKKIKAIKNW
jgi:hypothetical protein